MRRALRSLSFAAALAALLAAPPARGMPPVEPLSADDAAIAALAVALAAVPSPDPGGPGAALAAPRVELVATVSARSLAFDDVPRIRVALGAPGARRAIWRVERVNLPAAVEAGVVYRDVQVKLTLAATLDEFEALLGDARRLAREVRLEGTGAEPAAAPPPAAP